MKRSRLLLIAVPVIIVLGCLLALQRYQEVRRDLASLKEEQALKEKTLGKALALIAERPGLEKLAAELKDQRAAEETNLMEGQTLAIVAASLQDMVRTAVSSHGGTISSERTGRTEDLEPFKLISVTTDTILPDARALADILNALETRTPYLIIRDLDVRVRNVRQPKELSVKFDVAALTATSQEETAAPAARPAARTTVPQPRRAAP